MFDKDRVDYKREQHYLHLQRGTAEKLQEFIGKPQDDNRLRMRRIAIDFDSCKTRGQTI